MAPSLARKILLKRASTMIHSQLESEREAGLSLLGRLADDSEVYIARHRMPGLTAFAMQHDARRRAIATT